MDDGQITSRQTISRGEHMPRLASASISCEGHHSIWNLALEWEPPHLDATPCKHSKV